MNKTKIEWVRNPDGSPGFTWNPVTGCCHNCEFCYARRIAKRFGKTAHERAFRPKFHPERLHEPLKRKKPARIFVCSMSDLFGEWVPDEWIERVLDIVERCPQHTFQFLTKNPDRYTEIDFPDNVWLGATTVDQDAFEKAFPALERMKHRGHTTFVSVEPMLGPVLLFTLEVDQVIIGPQTGPGAEPPLWSWVRNLIRDARCTGAAVFLKDALEWSGYRPQEFPDERRTT